MKLINVIPLLKTPFFQTASLSYFYDKALRPGALVQIKIGNRKSQAIVESCTKVKEHKLFLKKTAFKLRDIDAVIYPRRIISRHQLELAKQLSKYYFVPPGMFLRLMIPSLLLKTKVEFPPIPNIRRADKSPRILSRPYKNFNYYLRQIQSAKGQILLVFPNTYSVSLFQNFLKQNNIAFVRLHPNLSPKQHFQAWKQIILGKPPVVIGTKKALFLPFSLLKTIIIDQEDDDNYKSSERLPHYNAKTAASLLGRISAAKVIFSSLSPSFSLSLKFPIKKRILDSGRIQIVDLKKPDTSSVLASATIKQISKFAKGVFYINRKGLARQIVCRDCGFVPMCPHCNIPLSVHTTGRKTFLVCHHCGYQTSVVSSCPKCSGYNLKSLGSGTQRVDAVLKRLFPKMEMAILDKDHTPTLKSQLQIIDTWNNKKRLFLIATDSLLKFIPYFKQAAIDRPQFVVVVNPDVDINLPTFGAGERVFLTLEKLSFWTEKLILQSFNPQHYVLTSVAQKNREYFLKKESSLRRKLKYPPFWHIIKISIRGKDAIKLENECRQLIDKILPALKKEETKDCFELLGPADAFVSRKKDLFTKNVFLKAKEECFSAKNEILKIIPPKWKITVDPKDIL